MNAPADNSDLGRKQFAIFAYALVMLVVVVGIALVARLPMAQLYLLLPTLTTIAIFLVFSILLKRRVGDALFGELGFLYMGLAVAYTIIPGIAFMVAGLDLGRSFVWAQLAQLLPAPHDLGIHLWRHVLFVFGVGLGYLLVRGHEIPQPITIKDPDRKDALTIIVLIGMMAICIVCLTGLSAPVNNYWDNYTRYDHLPWVLKKLTSVCTRLKLGIYSVLMTFLFINFKKFKFIIPFVIIFLCSYETVVSFGSRIESLFVLLGAVCLYNFTVKIVSLKKGLVACLALTVLFSAVELVRGTGFSLEGAQTTVSAEGIQPASEFGAVYFAGYHLYAERAQGTLPAKEIPMFFNDFISAVTFNAFTQWNPQYWYARNYFPDAAVPPETLGPIADSAIWGGEIDLLIRSLINGAFFAYLVRWFLHRQDKWWGVAVYVYCYATCVMTLKYSIFYDLTPLVKNLLPVLLIVEVVRRLIPGVRKSGATITA